MELEPVATTRTNAGWTAEKQGYFLRHLAATGSVTQSCALVGMSVRSVYYLRTRPDAEDFRRAWGHALEIAGAALLGAAFERAIHGSPRRYYRDGKLVGEVVAPSDRLLSWLLNRFHPTTLITSNPLAQRRGAPTDDLLASMRRLVDIPPTALDLEEADEEPALPPAPAAIGLSPGPRSGPAARALS